MNHDEARALLSASIDGALTAQEAAELDVYLAAHPSVREEVAQLRATVTMLQEMEPVQVPDGFAAAVRGRIEHLSQAAPRPTRERLRIALPEIRWSWRTAAAAAAVALIGIFGVNLLREVAPVSRETQELEGPRAYRPALFPKAAPRNANESPASSQDATGRVAQPAAPSVAQPGDSGGLRRVIRTGQVAIDVEKFDDAARRLLAIAEGAGGFIADSSYAEEGGAPRGTFVLRVPAARFGDVARQIEGLGAVRHRQYHGQDVTEEFIDLEARIRNLERQEARLLSFMDRATKIPDLMAIENEVARVRGEIERLTGRHRFLANGVDLATIQAEVNQKPKKAPGGFWDFDRMLARIEAAFLNTVRQLLETIEGMVAFAAAILPLGLLGLLGWVVLRRVLHRANRPV